LKWLIATGATATLAMVAYMGPAAVPAYIQQSSDNVTFWQTWPAVTYSIHGVIARLFIGGRWAEPLTQAPTLAHVVEALLMLVLVTCAARASARSCPKDDEGDRGFAVWTILLVLLNPISMGHNGVLLALPIVLTARALGTDGRTWAKVAWVAGVVLASIPRQTLVSMTATPLDPLRSVFFTALPMWGALSLCAVALATAGNPRSRTSYFEIDNPAIGTSGSPFPASTVSP
jgi:hypothetical protein